jgi:type II secretory pathway pseudopilin PulG
MKASPAVRRQPSSAVSRRLKATAAFTLIELMTAIVILIMLVGMLVVTFNSASTAWRAGERDVERFQDARAIFDLIARDLQQAYVSPNIQFYASDDKHSMAFGAVVSDNPNAVDLAEVVYWLNLDETTTPPFKLYRRFTPSSANQWDFYSHPLDWPNTAANINLVCDNIINFSVTCYKTNSPPNDKVGYWNSTATASVWDDPTLGIRVLQKGDGDMTNVPPAYVDVVLSVVDSRTAALLRQPSMTTAAASNVIKQATRTFEVFIKVPQR